MKKFLLFLVASLTLAVVGCSQVEEYDDSAIWEEIEAIYDRIEALEELCQRMNSDIAALQTIVSALQNNDYITSITPIVQDGVTIGYTIAFAHSDSITIYHGKDGKDGADGKDGVDGKDGSTPVIGVKKDSDNIYYWTLNGEWLLDDEGNKIKAVGIDGTDGENGADGKDGENGADGKDGITPQLKIEDGYWYVSYDNGINWRLVAKATGEDGKDGVAGDSFFKSITQDDNYVYFTLVDGTVITVPKATNAPEVPEVSNPEWEIHYTSIDGNVVTPYKVAFGGVNIVSNTYTDGEGVIKFDGKVTEIGKTAFFMCTTLDGITIPSAVTSIGADAFYNCSELFRIDIPSNVLSIGYEAFGLCNKLKIVQCAKGLTSIGELAFDQCGALTSVTLPSSLEIIGNKCFRYCARLSTITLPASIKSIGASAFASCSKLQFFECKATTPPTGGADMFSGVHANFTIRVPSGSGDAYTTAEFWSNYASKINATL